MTDSAHSASLDPTWHADPCNLVPGNHAWHCSSSSCRVTVSRHMFPTATSTLTQRTALRMSSTLGARLQWTSTVHCKALVRKDSLMQHQCESMLALDVCPFKTAYHHIWLQTSLMTSSPYICWVKPISTCAGLWQHVQSTLLITVYDSIGCAANCIICSIYRAK